MLLCLRYSVPLFTKRLEPIEFSRSTSSVVFYPFDCQCMCCKGSATKISSGMENKEENWDSLEVGKAGYLCKLPFTLFRLSCFVWYFVYILIKELSNVKEEVYGALDSFIAWDLEFPLITVKKALKTLENDREWKRIIQVTKWMLSKGQGRTMGTYFTLLTALAEDGRLDEAEELWAKLFSENLESTPRIFFDKMISIYYNRGMYDQMFEIFADMEELVVQPNVSIVNMMGNAFKNLGMLDKYEKLVKKYPPPRWEYRYFKGKRVRVRARPKYEVDVARESISKDDEETNQNPNESPFDEAEANLNESSFDEAEAKPNESSFDEAETNSNIEANVSS
ncbi:hypothetical protein JRO89_XS11G0205700 [Xanthoceras sorbifolium]|uniref:Pentatricopeptide repeat-containing protein n=1 Tax=Xanthoceras sorbifolium TaxID=99658 RepID=A0ABQ8HGI5_9ROSI|nr:hypothetical protein JRO89_XS11G0205700 [Xanthoceras sorbifolium]